MKSRKIKDIRVKNNIIPLIFYGLNLGAIAGSLIYTTAKLNGVNVQFDDWLEENGMGSSAI